MTGSDRTKVAVFIATGREGFIDRPDGDVSRLHEGEQLEATECAIKIPYYEEITRNTNFRIIFQSSCCLPDKLHDWKTEASAALGTRSTTTVH